MIDASCKMHSWPAPTSRLYRKRPAWVAVCGMQLCRLGAHGRQRAVLRLGHIRAVDLEPPHVCIQRYKSVGVSFAGVHRRVTFTVHLTGHVQSPETSGGHHKGKVHAASDHATCAIRCLDGQGSMLISQTELVTHTAQRQ